MADGNVSLQSNSLQRKISLKIKQTKIIYQKIDRKKTSAVSGFRRSIF